MATPVLHLSPSCTSSACLPPQCRPKRPSLNGLPSSSLQQASAITQKLSLSPDPLLFFGKRFRNASGQQRSSGAGAARCVSEGERGDGGTELSGLDRRQLLLASSLGLAGLPFANEVVGAPIGPPDFNHCNTPIDPGNGAPLVDCCLPPSANIFDFKFPPNVRLRTRQPAHLVSSSYIAKYNRAYQLLRQLPENDPRQQSLQANVHCAFCDGAYTESGFPEELQVHNSWLFFPWHRWYLYFHERILAKLINDDSFALPFWNWDSAAGSSIPTMYVNNSAISNKNRNPLHLPPTVVNLNYDFTESTIPKDQQIAANYATMYRQVVSNSKTPYLFFGLPYRAGNSPSPGPGTVENVPHGTVHTWTGNPKNPNDEDMGALYSAARDPIFFAHHSNVDRLWEVWLGLGGRRKNITDLDWLNASFIFYDENSRLVRVKVKDALDTTKIGYVYQPVDNPWLKSKPSPFRSLQSKMLVPSFVGLGGNPHAAEATIKEKLQEFKELKLDKLKGIVKSKVKRPKRVKADDYEEEVLLIEGVEIPSDQVVKFDVFINLPDADKNTPTDVSEYAGSFHNLPHLGKHSARERLRKSNFRIGVGEVLRELGVENDDDFSVTIVPRVGSDVHISIDDIKIEYE